MKTGPTRHPFVDDGFGGDGDYYGTRWCSVCNLPEANAIHNMPERDEDERQAEERKMGERD